MRRKDFQREEALKLRLQGGSLREIARALDVSLSSVSVWVRDVPRGGDAQEPQDPVAPPSAPEPSRLCRKCRKNVHESAFNRHPKGRQWWCKECFRAYFKNRGELHRRQSGKAKRTRQVRAREFVAQHLRTHPCVDCGEPDHVVLEFDHIGEKRGHLSVLKAGGYSIAFLRREIEQCEVVCVSCHRRRTARRGSWRRATKEWWKTPPPGDQLQARNLAYAYSYLERHPCVDCGCDDLCVLDFDHVGSKADNVLILARRPVSLMRLEAEIAQCQVRCANCHRRRTAEGQAQLRAG